MLAGRGELTVDEDTKVVETGDVIYLPPFCRHRLHNPVGGADVELLTVWWGGAAAETAAASGFQAAQ